MAPLMMSPGGHVTRPRCGHGNGWQYTTKNIALRIDGFILTIVGLQFNILNSGCLSSFEKKFREKKNNCKCKMCHHHMCENEKQIK